MELKRKEVVSKPEYYVIFRYFLYTYICQSQKGDKTSFNWKYKRIYHAPMPSIFICLQISFWYKKLQDFTRIVTYNISSFMWALQRIRIVSSLFVCLLETQQFTILVNLFGLVVPHANNTNYLHKTKQPLKQI